MSDSVRTGCFFDMTFSPFCAEYRYCIKELTDYIVRLKDAFKEGMLDKETYESFVADANEQLSKERGETTADRVKDHILNKNMIQEDEIDMEDDNESIMDDNERESE